ncbi:MAG: HTH domain-containing protein [Deltaproteobacteria bacterium]|nr:HTH domain-containing protein [Deltaproteobacteria bacterium]
MDQLNQYLQFQKAVVESKLKVIEEFQKGGQVQPRKRTSKIDIAHNVLNNAGKPLHVSEIIQLAKDVYDIQLDRDSIVSAILKKVKADQTFVRTAPNTFALK